MGQNKTPGTVLGLVGCAAAGWGMYEMARSVGCGDATGVPCPPDWLPGVLGAGIVVSVVSSFFGRGAYIFIGMFLAIGGGALGGGLQTRAEGGSAMVLLGSIFLGVVLLPVLLLPFAVRKRRRAQRLLESGGEAIGTVVSFRDTGVTVNRNPRIELKLRIEPIDRSPAFDGSKTAVISRLTPPYVGQRYPVWYDRDDRSVFMLGADMDDDAPPRARRLFELARAGDPGRPDAGAGPATDAVASAVPVPPSPLDQLAQLNDLRLAGALTEEEFNQQKAKLLSTD
jgi:hypothetical protein